MSKLVSINIKQDDFNLPTPEVLQEQNLAIYDLTQSNSFQLVGFDSFKELKLNISLSGNSLVFEVSSKANEVLKTFFLSLTPLRQIIDDYNTICKSYFNAVKNLSIDKIEGIPSKKKSKENLRTGILATICVEKKSQKGILIGKGGSMLKKIGQESRLQIQTLINGNVYLELFVKVVPDWRSKSSKLNEFGYERS